ncbi:amino acid adenylation domain-containing protein [Paenibacillus sp. MAHUQ-46]|uniref:Amino acid adenylation domain-containing protein n=1 Tax=Paenibacillus roseus TaxID=2798579 RepID=A0A934J3X2_9BACL|nr:amino acid adenylation domain-containing protein [Paenibacillus roseus]
MNQEIVMERVSRNQSLPLSVEQYRLWFLSQLDPDSIHFNINMAFRIQGSLQEELFERSLNELVCRHESLRTVFHVRDQEPEQVILDQVYIPIAQTDLSHLPAEERELRAIDLMNEEIQQPFSLEAGPLLRARIYRLAAEERILLFTIHHIIADFSSLVKIIQELGVFYTAFINEKAPELPLLPLQFADYTYWQKVKMQGASYDKQLHYWREKLGGELPVLRMPVDRPHSPVMTHNGARLRITISPELTAELKALSRKSGVTLFNTLLAAYQTLLYRYTGQNDICIGTSISTRNKPELQDMIGMLVNNLVLRVNLAGEPTFAEVLKLARKTAFGAFAHQDIPYEKLIDELQSDRDRSRNPFFQTMLTHLHAPPSDVQSLPGVTIKRFEFNKKPSALELSFTITENQDVLEAVMDYNTDLFNGDTIERMLGHFQHLLQEVVLDPHRSILELPIISEAESQQILYNWSGKSRTRPLPEASVHDLFTRQASRTPEAVAIRFKNQQYTYRELDERSNQVAHYLIKKGLVRNQLVGICLDRSLELIVGLLGILKAGGAYIPLDPSYPQERLTYMLQNAQAPILITTGERKTRFEGESCSVIALDEEWKSIAQEPYTVPEGKANPNDLIYVIYTSGSTGTPKGVMVSHQGVVNHCFNIIDRFQLTPRDRVLQFTSISFDVAVQEIFPTLLAGSTLVLWKDKYLSEGGEFLAWIQQEEISVLNLTTAHWSNLVSDLKYERAELPSSLKLVIVGGEKVSYETFLTWRRLTAGQVRWINDYGLTETTITATMFEPDIKWQVDKVIPVGQPLNNVEIYILNHRLELVPTGVFGELYIGGAGLALGYLGQPNLSRNRFIQHPFSDDPNAKVFKTGDLARFLPDGNVEFLGRLDHQVKVRGYRIEIGEIEVQLQQYGKLAQSVVVPRTAANGEVRLAAYVVLGDSNARIEELKSFLKSRLPDYMVPSHYVVLDQIPLTVNGKVDTAALPKPELLASKDKEYLAPRTTSEATAVDIWRNLLENPAVGVLDNFFEVGGNSLLATQVVSQAKARFGCDIPLRYLFEYPVLADWAAQIDGIKLALHAQPESEPCMVKIQQKGEKNPLFFFHPVGGSITCYFTLTRQLGEDQPFYAFQSHKMVNSSLTPETIEEMANAYLQEILAFRPEGPYRLGGWSMGGFIAYEVARKLKEAGQEVIQLALIDSYLSKTTDASEETVLYHFIKQLAAVPGYTISDSILLSWKAIGLDRDSLYRELQALDLLPPGTTSEEVSRLFDVYMNTVQAFQKYNPGPREKLDIAHVQLFRAEDSHEQEGEWSRLVTNLSLHQVKADHFSIVHNAEVGRWIDIQKNLLPIV